MFVNWAVSSGEAKGLWQGGNLRRKGSLSRHKAHSNSCSHVWLRETLDWAGLGRGLQRMVPGESHFLAPHTIVGTALHGAFAEVERGPHFVSRFSKYEPFLRTSFQIE